MSGTVKVVIEIPKEVKQEFDKTESVALKGAYFDLDGIIGNAIKNGIPLDENKGDWIPVSERLPEKNEWVLVTVEQNEMRYQEIMRRNNYIEAWTDNIDNYTDEIIAWQPLPEPYKAESEEV